MRRDGAQGFAREQTKTRARMNRARVRIFAWIPTLRTRRVISGYTMLRAEDAGKLKPLLTGAVERDLVARIGVAHDAGCRIVP